MKFKSSIKDFEDLNPELVEFLRGKIVKLVPSIGNIEYTIEYFLRINELKELLHIKGLFYSEDVRLDKYKTLISDKIVYDDIFITVNKEGSKKILGVISNHKQAFEWFRLTIFYPIK
jgi:hypothetical protein